MVKQEAKEREGQVDEVVQPEERKRRIEEGELVQLASVTWYLKVKCETMLNICE